MAAKYGVYCKDCNEVFGTYDSLDDASQVARLHCEVNDHDCSTVEPVQTMGDPSSTPE